MAEAAGTLADWIAAVAQARDRTAFACLFRHFAPRIAAFAARFGVPAGAREELAQEVMLAVWLKAESFDPALSSPATWVFSIARNRAIDRFRREARPELDPDDPALVPSAAADPEENASLAQEERGVRAALKSLPPEQSDLLRLSYYEDKSHSEIAAALGLPLGTVKSRIRAAMRCLERTMRTPA